MIRRRFEVRDTAGHLVRRYWTGWRADMDASFHNQAVSREIRAASVPDVLRVLFPIWHVERRESR